MVKGNTTVLCSGVSFSGGRNDRCHRATNFAQQEMLFGHPFGRPGSDVTVKVEGLDLKLGSPFQPTPLGTKRCSSLSLALTKRPRLFDGTKTPRSLHRSYIEPVSTETRKVALAYAPIL
jgi:hypothetical protein